MRVFLVLYKLSANGEEYGYHDSFVNKEEAIKEMERMNQTEKGMYYEFVVKYKDLGN